MSCPPLEEFVRHAQLFGTECVAETAAQEWRRRLPAPADLAWMAPAERQRVLDEGAAVCGEVLADACRLRIELDAAEAEQKNGRYTVGKRRRRSEVETARYAWALALEWGENNRGIERKIADKLGISDAYARRALNLGRTMAETPEKAPRNPSRQAAKFATKPEPGTLPQPARKVDA